MRRKPTRSQLKEIPDSGHLLKVRKILDTIVVIDYIVVHELAHLIEPNHTARFWNIVAVQAPRYKKAKEWLRQKGKILEEDF